MKLLVEIDEATYKDIKKGKVYSSFRDVPQESVLAIANGIPVPDNATNGDVIRAMFPNTAFSECDGAIDIGLYWWNSPYQKGGKE